MQIKGEEFVKKVQIQQEREELERKLNELEEVEMSINNDSVILERNNTNDYNSNSYNNNIEDTELQEKISKELEILASNFVIYSQSTY